MYVKNRKARFNFEISEELTVGLVLSGWMVKALYAHNFEFDSSYIIIKNNELFCIGLGLSPRDNIDNHINEDDPTIKLLATKKQINHLKDQLGQKGMTLVPLSLYSTKGKKSSKVKLKMDIGLAKGKNLVDKKRHLKEKDIKKLSDSEMKKSLKV